MIEISTAEPDNIYTAFGLFMTRVEQAPFFKEKGDGILLDPDELPELKIRNIGFDEKFQNAIFVFNKKYNTKIVLAVDLINTDFRSFIALPYIGGITIRKAKVDIRSALLKYFVDSTFLKNQTKDLYIRRSLYAQKNSTAKPPSDNCNSKEN